MSGPRDPDRLDAPDPGLGEVAGGLMAHLLELRTRLMRALLALGLVFAVLLPFANELYARLAEPLLRFLPVGGQLIAIDVASPFFAPMKLALFVALLVAMPFMLYQAWAFIAPGLYRNERRLALPLLLAAVALFYAGLAFAYFLLLPAMFAFFTATVPEGVAMMTDINAYLGFVLVMGLSAGLAFEVPVAVMVAVLMRWVTPAQLAEWRGYVVVAMAIFAALLTPPDGLSMVMLLLPMWLLYEAGLLVGRLVVRSRAAEA